MPATLQQPHTVAGLDLPAPRPRFGRLAVFSHKLCWPSSASPSGYATDGGFALQMGALAGLFSTTHVLVPCAAIPNPVGEVPFAPSNLKVIPLTVPAGLGVRRKLAMIIWVLRHLPRLIAEVAKADAVHAPIPGDVGTIGMLLAVALRKPLFVRHCGNWNAPETTAEHFWRWFMETFAGGRNVMLATGGSEQAPSEKNCNVRWIFSTSLSREELESCAVTRSAPVGRPARLIIACRQETEKGTGRIIEALPLIHRAFPGVTLEVLGDGTALAKFKALAQSTGMVDHVRFHGKVDHHAVIRSLQGADVFCFPTTSSEGFPKAVLEAMACGLPVVTTRVSVLPALVGSTCGILLDEASPSAIAQAVQRLLSDPVLFEDCSAQAVKKARSYSLESWSETIGQYLRPILERK